LIPAIDRHDITTVKQLLDRGVRVDDPGPLCVAAQENEPAVVKLLLDRGANVEAKDQAGVTALVCAARAFSDTTETMKLLIANGATPEDKAQALFAVAEEVIVVLEVPRKKRQAGIPKHTEQSPAMNPWDLDSIKKVKLLIESGVDVNVRDKVRGNATPLLRAASFGNTAVVRLLLEKGARVDANDEGGSTALIGAACNCAIIDMPDTIDSMRLLLRKGANVEARDRDGNTALTRAAGWGRTDIVKLLLDNGAQIDDKDKSGNTALIISAEGSAVPTAGTVKLLLEKGADIEAKNNEGNTPLILAASKGGYEDAAILKLLLEKGADLGAKNNQGDSALTLATKKGRVDIVQILKKAIARSS